MTITAEEYFELTTANTKTTRPTVCADECITLMKDYANLRVIEMEGALQDATLHFTQGTFSTRPCVTCALVSVLLKEPFGCEKLRKK